MLCHGNQESQYVPSSSFVMTPFANFAEEGCRVSIENNDAMFEIPRSESEVSGPTTTSSYAPPSHCSHPPTLLEPFILLLPAASWNLSESSPLCRRRHLVRLGTKAAWQPCETGFLPSREFLRNVWRRGGEGPVIGGELNQRQVSFVVGPRSI